MTSPLILGIESSCDETAAAVVRGGREVLSTIVATQHDLHQRYGGVVPEIASRAHLERILPVIEEALRTAGVGLDDLDGIGVTHQPGLIGSLLVGLGAAKALAFSTGLPLIGVNHLQAHLWSPSLDGPPLDYPAVGVIASGGHTMIGRIEGPTDIRPLGQTIDDAIGEAFDKVATVLDAGYPGGPAIERLAEAGDDRAISLPISRLGDSLDVSYSGLKTAVLYAVRGQPRGRGSEVSYPRSAADLSPSQRADVAATFQRVAIAALIRQVRRALAEAPVCSLLAGGGVTANRHFRKALAELCEDSPLKLRLAAPAYCIDNAAMVAGLAGVMLEEGQDHGLEVPAVARVAWS